MAVDPSVAAPSSASIVSNCLTKSGRFSRRLIEEYADEKPAALSACCSGPLGRSQDTATRAPSDRNSLNECETSNEAADCTPGNTCRSRIYPGEPRPAMFPTPSTE